jgi:hypothetical protein
MSDIYRAALAHPPRPSESKSDGLNNGETKAEDAEPESDEDHDAEPDPNDSTLTAARMFFDSDGGLNAIKQLLRYEAAAERSYYRAFHTLERVQARRIGKDFSPPQVKHVHANE